MEQNKKKNHDMFGLAFTAKKYRKVKDKDGNVREVEVERWDSDGNRREVPEAVPAAEEMPENEVKPPKKEEE